jgi:hypothetical protein
MAHNESYEAQAERTPRCSLSALALGNRRIRRSRLPYLLLFVPDPIAGGACLNSFGLGRHHFRTDHRPQRRVAVVERKEGVKRENVLVRRELGEVEGRRARADGINGDCRGSLARSRKDGEMFGSERATRSASKEQRHTAHRPPLYSDSNLQPKVIYEDVVG